MAEPINIEVFTDYVWPWCYLSTVSIEKLRKEEDVNVTWSFFPLHPETPKEGLALSKLFQGREAQLQGFMQQTREVAAREGLDYGKRTMTYNSRLAQELGSWADGFDNGDMLHDLLYRAYFVDNQNISDLDVLLELTERAGLDVESAKDVLLNRTESEKIDLAWQRARSLGITGVPTYFSNDLVVVGCQSYDILLRFVTHLKKLRDEQ